MFDCHGESTIWHFQLQLEHQRCVDDQVDLAIFSIPLQRMSNLQMIVDH